MKIGFVSAILPEYTLEEVLGFAAEAGFSSVELMCWPPGKAERRYAGVTHFDASDLTPAAIKTVQDLSASTGGAWVITRTHSLPTRPSRTWPWPIFTS
jgi:sugar phosphate isomerase/epimerase